MNTPFNPTGHETRSDKLKPLLSIFATACLFLITLAVVLPVASDTNDKRRAENFARQACEVGIYDDDWTDYEFGIYNSRKQSFAGRAAFLDPKYEGLRKLYGDIYRMKSGDIDPANVDAGILSYICNEISEVYAERFGGYPPLDPNETDLTPESFLGETS